MGREASILSTRHGIAAAKAQTRIELDPECGQEAEMVVSSARRFFLSTGADPEPLISSRFERMAELTEPPLSSENMLKLVCRRLQG
jgi:hypothetical protein